MSELWDKQQGESAQAYRAFEAILNQWPNLNFLEAYRNVSGKEKAKGISGTWRLWKNDWEWDKRLAAYDQWRQQEKSRARQQAAAEKYASDLEDYRRMHENAGKVAFNNVMLCSQILQKTVQRMLDDPATHPKTYNELKQLSGVIGDFMRYGPSAWGEALGIPQIEEKLARLEELEKSQGDAIG